MKMFDVKFFTWKATNSLYFLNYRKQLFLNYDIMCMFFSLTNACCIHFTTLQPLGMGSWNEVLKIMHIYLKS